MKSRLFVSILALILTSPLVSRSQSPLYVEPLDPITVSTSPISRLILSQDGVLSSAYSADGTTKIISVKNGEERASFTLDPSVVTCVAFLGDENLVAGRKDGTIQMLNIATGTTGPPIEACGASVVGIRALSDSTVLVCDADGLGEIMDMREGEEIRSIDFIRESITAVAFNGVSGAVVLLARNGTIRPFDSGYSEQDFVTEPERIQRVMAFTPDGKFLILTHPDESMTLWDADAWSQTGRIDSLGAAVVSVSVDPAQRWIAIVANDSVLRLIDFSSLTVLKEFRSEESVFTDVSFVTDDQLWIGGSDGVVRRWQLLTRPPDTTAPQLVFTDPVASDDSIDVRVYAKEYVIHGKVFEDHTLSAVLVGGVPATISGEVSEDSVGRKWKEFSARVNLGTDGLNPFAVTASDEQGNSSEQTLGIYRLSRDEAVEILQPAANEQTERVVVPLEFKTWFPVRSYAVSVNLSEIFQGKGRSLSSGEQIREEVPLVMGYNQIQLKIRGVGGEEFTRMIGVTRKVSGMEGGAVAARKPSVKRGPGPQAWAVVVGISEYADANIPALKYADRDAEAFASFLRTPEGGGYDSDHLRVLLNKEATLANLKDALMNFLQYAIDKDLVMIYFAGHGAPEPSRPDNLYLLTYDSNPATLATSAFPMWDVQTAIARYISAKRIVVFSDACHSGGISVGYATRGMDVTESNLINQYFSDLARTKEGVVVFTASAAGEVSQEFPDLAHGVFTYYLLEGVKGDADFNNDYTVTINELMQYVEENVKRKTRGAQNPTRSQTSYDKDLTISLIAHE